MRTLFDLTGTTALLTGASRGMGFEMARSLADHGATVVISARKIEALEAAADEINAEVGETRAHAVAADISKPESLEALVTRAREVAGPIGVLVGNAGVNVHFGSTFDLTDEQFDKTMRRNVQANLHLARLVKDDMAELGSGSMMFTSSVGALRPNTIIGPYGVSKLALIGLVRNLAMELGPQGTRVNAICPGVIKTDFSRVLWETPELAEQNLAQIPLARFGEAEDFGGVAVYLASQASSYMTGQALTLCGGSTMFA